MRRALPVIGLTATGVALVLNFDTRDATEAVTIDESASVAVVETSGPAAAPTTVSAAEELLAQASPALLDRLEAQYPDGIPVSVLEGLVADTTSAAPAGPPADGPSTAPAAPAPADPTPTTSAAPNTPAAGTLTVTGPVAQSRFGPFQVEITVQDGVLTDVQLIVHPTDRRSQRINEQSAPVYREEALAAQSADIDVVSGATVTWQGYTTSLQAALDAAQLS